MLKLKKILTFFFLLIFFSFFISGGNHYVSAAETEQERLDRLTKEIEQYEKEIEKLKSQAGTLSNQIAQYDAQIRLTTLKIQHTEEKIMLLGGRITQLEDSLVALGNAFASRVVKTYKMSRLGKPYLMLLASSNLGNVVSSYHYLKRIQEADRDLLVRLEKAQFEYKTEKTDQEKLQKELESQKSVLANQKAAKAILLEQTRNDEKRYQQLLSAARSEYEAIQAIIAGKGTEVDVGPVNQGQKIASIIQGPSCNSSGEHLHFIISQGGNTKNPFEFLRGGVDYDNCSGSSCGSSDGDSFSPTGSWDWPINQKIKYTQGYGSTWAIKNTWVGRVYQFHNGIDLDSLANNEVKAVKSGRLYQGSYTGFNSCKLRYVRVDHEDSDLDTFYLHINY